MIETTEAAELEQFETFLKTFKKKKYAGEISRLIALGTRSLVVDYEDLLLFNNDLANKLKNNPEDTLINFDKAALNFISEENPDHADSIKKDFKVRIRSLSENVPLRNLTSDNLFTLISVVGIIVRASELQPLTVIATFQCKNGHMNEIIQNSSLLLKPSQCHSCNDTKSFELIERASEFIDHQVVRVQELPEELPPGQLPQSFDVSLNSDLVNKIRPGDRISLTGILKTEPIKPEAIIKQRLFYSRIDANYIELLGKGPEDITVSKEDEAQIRFIANSPNGYLQLINSIAPSVYGYETEKEAILSMLLGSPTRYTDDGMSIRGDLNVLLVGDPGTAKSELLKYASRIAPRGLYTSGRGSTAAGLTAAVVRERNSGVMTLEAGAIVLADQGLASIDEFDKMRTEDRSALHEAMEQQTVSVAKGGIVATLNARTSILAAANPILGKYDKYKTFYENLNLPIPLLTRFDLIFVITDIPDRTKDETLATHILELHSSGKSSIKPPLDSDLLKKYIIYAKKINPELTMEARTKIRDFYLKIRQQKNENMLPPTPRQLEGLVRLATSRARALLHEKVTEDDAIQGINLMHRALLTSAIDPTGDDGIDFGTLSGYSGTKRQKLDAALNIFRKLQGDNKNEVEGTKFVQELANSGKFEIDEAKKMLQQLSDSGVIYESSQGFYRRI